MRLRDVVNKFKDSPPFLLTINGICDEWYDGIRELPEEDYYKEYRDRKVREMSILLTNDSPELIITIEKENTNGD